MFRILFITLLFSFSASAFAIYKCENGDKITYSDVPCANGIPHDLGDQSNKSVASDVAKAKEQNVQEKRKLKQLEAARHKREAEEEKQHQKLANAIASKKKKCTSLALKKKWSNEDSANATGRKQENAKRRARHLSEKYEIECGKQ